MKPLLVTLAMLTFGTFSVKSVKADTVSWHVITQCQTPPTGGDGARHTCLAEASNFTAPEDYVIDQNATKIDNHGRGSYHDCNPSFTDFEPIIPGSTLTAPRTFSISGKAQGPSGHFSGTGEVVCDVNGTMTKFRHLN